MPPSGHERVTTIGHKAKLWKDFPLLAARITSMPDSGDDVAALINLRLGREHQDALERGPHTAPWQAPENNLTGDLDDDGVDGVEEGRGPGRKRMSSSRRGMSRRGMVDLDAFSKYVEATLLPGGAAPIKTKEEQGSRLLSS